MGERSSSIGNDLHSEQPAGGKPLAELTKTCDTVHTASGHTISNSNIVAVLSLLRCFRHVKEKCRKHTSSLTRLDCRAHMGVVENTSYCAATCSESQSFQAIRATYKRLTAGVKPPHGPRTMSVWVSPRGTCQLCRERRETVYVHECRMEGATGGQVQTGVTLLFTDALAKNLAPAGISR